MFATKHPSRCSPLFVVVVVRLVVSQVSELRKVWCSHAYHQQHLFSRLRTQSPILDESRSHFPCCEHSWAKQTTGPRTMRLRVRIQTVEKKVPNHAQQQTTRTGIHGQKSGTSQVTVPKSKHHKLKDAFSRSYANFSSIARCIVIVWHSTRDGPTHYNHRIAFESLAHGITVLSSALVRS